MAYKLFSADDHVDLKYLPDDLWQKRVSTSAKSRAPRVEMTPEGKRWMVNGTPFGGSLGKLPRPISDTQYIPTGAGLDNAFGTRYTPVVQSEGRWRITTPELREEDMDRDGVEAHVVYGPFMGIQVKDPALNTLTWRVFNDWMADFCTTIPNRLYGVGTLPVHDAQAAVNEIKHCAKLGLRGAQFHALDAYKFHWDAAWEPLWAAAAEAGISISFHHAGGNWSVKTDVNAPSFFGPPGRAVSAVNQVTVMSRLDEVLCSMVLAGILKRHPKLKIVLAECDLGWIPYVLERMDRKYHERHILASRDDAADLDSKPSNYYRRQIRVTFDEDPVGISLLHLIGPETVMWSSD